MKTTLDIPDEIYRKAQAQAELRGVPVGILFLEGLRQVLGLKEGDRATRRVTFPLLPSKKPNTLTPDDVRKAETLAELEISESHAKFL